MFTGIVSDIGEIESLTAVAQGQLHRLRIVCGYDRAGIADGASIADTTRWMPAAITASAQGGDLPTCEQGSSVT